MLVLGSTLSRGPVKHNMKTTTIVGICVARLVLAPLIAAGIVMLASKLGFFPSSSSLGGEGDGDDPLFKYVVLLQQAAPSAINIMLAATIHQNAVMEIASSLFWQYICSPVTLSFVLAGYLYIVTP